MIFSIYNKIIEYLLDIGAIGIGAKRVELIENNKEKIKWKKIHTT
jgi:hypothetical protein